jgi:hypothetical protein
MEYLESERARAGRLTRPERLLSVSEAIGARNVEQDRFLKTLEHSCQRSEAHNSRRPENTRPSPLIQMPISVPNSAQPEERFMLAGGF